MGRNLKTSKSLSFKDIKHLTEITPLEECTRNILPETMKKKWKPEPYFLSGALRSSQKGKLSKVWSGLVSVISLCVSWASLPNLSELSFHVCKLGMISPTSLLRWESSDLWRKEHDAARSFWNTECLQYLLTIPESAVPPSPSLPGWLSKKLASLPTLGFPSVLWMPQ